jgi:hypothetical protein
MRYTVPAIAMILSAVPVTAQNSPPPVRIVVPLSVGRVPHNAPIPGKVLDLRIPELGNFDFDEDRPAIPADVKALSGTTVRLRGFMIPFDSAENISRFALVPKLGSGGQNPVPPIPSIALVSCPKGKAVQYCGDEIVVEGKLTVGIMREDGFITGIFALETTSVKPAAAR